ncbi:MAG: PIN domain-containing protein [Bifidobacteriaceae bacterium]|nr:PIN domain-containing protein [Bifidobacteriaceae bacterium]
MILVDSSVLIDFLGSAAPRPKARLLARLIEQDVPFAICPFVYQEVLQGTADEPAYDKVKAYLDSQECLWLPPGLEVYAKAARIYWDLRRRGVTVRGTIDVLIALTAIEHEALLLHDDRDFDAIAAHLPQLQLA